MIFDITNIRKLPWNTTWRVLTPLNNVTQDFTTPLSETIESKDGLYLGAHIRGGLGGVQHPPPVFRKLQKVGPKFIQNCGKSRSRQPVEISSILQS